MSFQKVMDVDMSKIQTIQPNYQPAVQARLKKQNSPSFSGGATATVDELATMIARNARPVEKGFRKGVTDLSIYLNGSKGEIQNQLINAAFTTTFAPLFIAFNPFANQDKKTKEYTALRQPISAAIALGCSMPLTRQFNKYLANLGLNNMVNGADLRMGLEDDYLKKQFKDEYKAATDKEKFFQKYKIELPFDAEKLNKNGKVSRKYVVAARDAYIKEAKDARQGIFSKLIGENPKDIKLEDVKDIPGFETKEALDSYLSKQNLHNKTFGQFLEDEFKFEFHKGGALDGKFKSATLDKKLTDIKALDFLNQMGLINDKVTENDLRNMISLDRQEEKLATPLRKHIGNEDASNLSDAVSKQISRGVELQIGERDPKEKIISLKQLLNRFDLLDEKLQGLSNAKMEKVLNVFKTRLTNGKLKGFDANSGIKEFAANIIKHKSGYIGKNFEVLKKYSGVLVNVPITLVSCSLLNWAYPRLVERVFPSLVKDDAKKGGNK